MEEEGECTKEGNRILKGFTFLKCNAGNGFPAGGRKSIPVLGICVSPDVLSYNPQQLYPV